MNGSAMREGGMETWAAPEKVTMSPETWPPVFDLGDSECWSLSSVSSPHHMVGWMWGHSALRKEGGGGQRCRGKASVPYQLKMLLTWKILNLEPAKAAQHSGHLVYINNILKETNPVLILKITCLLVIVDVRRQTRGRLLSSGCCTCDRCLFSTYVRKRDFASLHLKAESDITFRVQTSLSDLVPLT